MHKGAIPYMHRSITVAIPSEQGKGRRNGVCGVRSAEWRAGQSPPEWSLARTVARRLTAAVLISDNYLTTSLGLRC